MKQFARAVVSGFAFTLGAALFKKVAKHIGLDDKAAKPAAAAEPTTASDPS